MKVDYLIVGQGLAGSLLAYEMRRAGHSFLVIDNPNKPKASDVAAGVVNPVVFRRMTKSWLIDELYPHLLKTYTELEKFLNVKLFYPMPIKKVVGKGDSDFWKQKYTENELYPYITPNTEALNNSFVHAEFGAGTVATSGRVDLKLLVNKMKTHLANKGILREEEFDFAQLQRSEDGITYRTISAQKVIFCEGHSASKNPFFQDIRFKHTKGEVLRVQAESYNEHFILNKAIFLMPEGNQYYRLGATYDWHNLSTETTEEARIELQKKLEKIFTDKYHIVDHQAGIRPTTHDRRPVIGLHPGHQQIGIFNGLGSKGTMLGPYFARQFVNFLVGNSQLDSEVDINRYFRHRE